MYISATKLRTLLSLFIRVLGKICLCVCVCVCVCVTEYVYDGGGVERSINKWNQRKNTEKS